MTRAFAISTALCLLGPALHAQTLPSARPEEVGLSSLRLARIQQTLRGEVEEKKLPGAVALVARKGKVAYFDAVGARDPGSGAPLGKDAIFRIYSMTKPFVSVAAMMLVEEGRIVLGDPVSKYLPAFAKMQVSVAKADSASGKPAYETVPAAPAPTVYDLLRHTSGLAYAFSTSNAPVKDAWVRIKTGVLSPFSSRRTARAGSPRPSPPIRPPVSRAISSTCSPRRRTTRAARARFPPHLTTSASARCSSAAAS